MLHRARAILFLSLYGLSACTTAPVSHRSPASQTKEARLAEEAAYEEKKNQFYLSLLTFS
jgi:hypothetical protein